MSSRLPLLVSVLVGLAAAATPCGAQGTDVRLPLTVAFVGEVDSARARDFRAYLERFCQKVRSVERSTCVPARLADVDVVILDWPQKDGIMAWATDRDAPRTCPLGKRADWKVPTVLVGSAGLSLATAWDLKGGFG